MSYIGNQPYQSAFVTDTFSGNGSTTAFTMSVAPAGTTSVLVAVTGVLQDPSTYSVTGTTLTFSAAPPSGTGNISVRYLGIPASGVTTTAYRTVTEFTATAGQTTFTPPSYTVGYINVYRNGVLLGSADYTATNGTTVVLAKAATAGDLVVVESFYVSSVLNAIPATAGSVGTTYIADNSITTAKIVNGAIIQADLATGVAGTGPTFSAYQNATTTVNNATWTKVALQLKEFDTASAFDNTTNYRFQPTVAGYYQVNGCVNFAPNASGFRFVYVYKNGSASKNGGNVVGGSVNYTAINVSAIIYLNGSTDYIELYANQNSGSNLATSGNADVYFQAALVRAA